MTPEELKTDFVRRFGASPYQIGVISAGMPIYFCGNPEKPGFDTVSAPLSLKATAVFRRLDDHIIDLREESSTVKYTAPFSSLNAHNNVIMRFFGYLRRSNVPICGMQILIANEALPEYYSKCACAAAALAMSRLTDMPASDAALSKLCAGFFGEGLSDFLTMLSAKRGYCIYRRAHEPAVSYLPLNAEDFHIILIRGGTSGFARKNDTALRISFTNTVTTSAAELLENAGFAEFVRAAASVEIKSSRSATDACEEIMSFEGVYGIREDCGFIWAAVKRDRTDAAVSKIEDAFLKHTGALPRLYITEIFNS